MKQHPIPRDIGSFKFKLVGNMTIGQFTMFSLWTTVAYVTYLAPLPAVIKYPLVIITIFLAFAFPFLPIEERPLHHWIVVFIRAAFFTELRRVWRKAERGQGVYWTKPSLGRQPPSQPLPLPHGQTIPLSPPTHVVAGPPPPPPQVQTIRPRQLRPAQQPPHEISLPPVGAQPTYEPLLRVSVPPPPPPPPPSIETRQQTAQEIIQQASVAQLKKIAGQEEFPQPQQVLRTKNASLAQTIKELEGELDEIRRQQGQSLAQKKSLADEVTLLQQKLAGAIAQRESLNQELYSLQHQPAIYPVTPSERRVVVIQPQVVVPRSPTPAPKAVEGTAAAIVPGQLPQLTSLPNAINGIVRGRQGEFLSDVIVVIKDTAGLPARALKTNRLGQFVISTPLENGTYYIDLEKDSLAFDTIEITATGRVLPPLLIQAK